MFYAKIICFIYTFYNNRGLKMIEGMAGDLQPAIGLISPIASCQLPAPTN